MQELFFICSALQYNGRKRNEGEEEKETGGGVGIRRWKDRVGEYPGNFSMDYFHLLAVQWEFDIYCLLVSNEKFFV